MTATVAHTPVTSYDPEDWESGYARSLLEGCSPSAARCIAEDAADFASAYPEFKGAALCISGLAGVTDASELLILKAARR